NVTRGGGSAARDHCLELPRYWSPTAYGELGKHDRPRLVCACRGALVAGNRSGNRHLPLHRRLQSRRRWAPRNRRGPAPVRTNLLSVRGLTVSYSDQGAAAVRHVSLSRERGEFHGLVGESGSGKSTIARALLGLTDSGAKVFGGKGVPELSSVCLVSL